MEFYFDFISPYAYLAATRIDGFAARYGRRVNWSERVSAGDRQCEQSQYDSMYASFL